MRLDIFEVFALLEKAKSKAEKVKILRENNSGALQDICRGAFDKHIVWLLPKDDKPPYTPNRPESVPSNLLRETKKLGYLVKGGLAPNMMQVKREAIFIGILESIHPEDALILIQAINKKAPKGLTRASVEEAFPNLLMG